MDIDISLYRRDIIISTDKSFRISVIDIAPDHPQRTMIFIHGYAGEAKQWVYQLQHFSINNRVTAIDLHGHGRSEIPGASYTMPVILNDLSAALDTLGITSKYILIGHSFGGAIASEYAAAHPDRVERLILIATAAEYKLNPLFRLALNLPENLLRIITPLVKKQLGAKPHILKSWYQQNLAKWKGWQTFEQISIPTLIIRGHRDLVFERPMFEDVHKRIMGSEDINVGASGHMVMLERREAVNRAIERFLEDSKLSWRDAERVEKSQVHSELLRTRPWLVHYEAGVPHTLAIPRVSIPELLESANRRFPHRKAVIFEGKLLTYLQVNKDVNRFANALISLGINKGDRVLIYLPNTPQFIIAFFAVLKVGGVAVFAQPVSDHRELSKQLIDSGARTLISLSNYAELVRRAMREAKESLVTTDLISEAGILSQYQIIFTDVGDYIPRINRIFSQLFSRKVPNSTIPSHADAVEYLLRSLYRRQSTKRPDVEVLSSDLAVIAYTGGTTSMPKGVMLTHYNLVANALQTRHWLPNAKDGKERFLCVLPFSHSYGLTTALITPISLGASLILKPRLDVTDILKSIKRYQPTLFPGIPGLYQAIKDYPGVRSYRVDSINYCISGSAPLPVEVQEAFERLTRGRLVEGYGLTEASPVTHANPLNGLRKVGSIGIPLPSTEAKIVDLKKGDEVVKQGQIGELVVRGPQVMRGYWQDPEGTTSVLKADGWLLTGDVAQMDSDGYFRIIARKADVWYPNKRGSPAFPRDTEEVLFEIPQIKEAVVVAIASRLVAFIRADKDHPDSDAIIAYCKRRLTPELVPKLVYFIDDMPRTFIGKVLRRELVKRFDDQLHEKSITSDQL
jgi:long-chain acyl-CoA synthetase